MFKFIVSFATAFGLMRSAASSNITALVVSHNPDDAIGLNATEITLPISFA